MKHRINTKKKYKQKKLWQSYKLWHKGEEKNLSRWRNSKTSRRTRGGANDCKRKEVTNCIRRSTRAWATTWIYLKHHNKIQRWWHGSSDSEHYSKECITIAKHRQELKEVQRSIVYRICLLSYHFLDGVSFSIIVSLIYIFSYFLLYL